MKATRRWKVCGAAALIAVASVAVIAGSSPGGPPIDDVSEIVPTLSRHQDTTDHLPNPAAKAFAPLGIDPTSTRFVGESTALTYYAAPLGNDEICLIVVNERGGADRMGCTVVQGFEGLRIANGDKTEEACLVAPSGAQKVLESADRSQWVQTAPNFLVKSAS